MANKDKCLVVGSARGVWDDLMQVDVEFYDIMTVNDVGMHLPFRVKYWYSNDSKMLPKWHEARRPSLKLLYGDIPLYSCYTGKGVTQVDVLNGQGTSGMNAAHFAVKLGYKKVVLAGVPLDNSGHYFDPPGKRTNFELEEPDMGSWKYAKDNYFQGKVSSLSGRTEELLGRP